MSDQVPKDNGSFSDKLALRRSLLRELVSRTGAEPLVLETHGGMGKMYDALPYPKRGGLVLERDPHKVSILAQQRPGWAVYEADSEQALGAGLGAKLPFDFVDIDPYGNPWPTLSGYLTSVRARPRTIAIAVTDGLRQGVRRKAAWRVTDLGVPLGAEEMAARYLELARDRFTELVEQADYFVDLWTGYYSGDTGNMTLYGAILRVRG